MNESQNGKQVVVSNAGQYSFTYVEYEGGPEIHIRHDQIDFPIYNGYIVTRVYQDEVIILIPGSESGDPRLEFTLEIPALQAYSEYVYRMNSLLRENLNLAEAEELFELLQGLKEVFQAMGSVRSSEFGNRLRSLKDRCVNALGLSSSDLSHLYSLRHSHVNPRTVLKKAHQLLVEETFTPGMAITARRYIDLISYILEKRRGELKGTTDIKLTVARDNLAAKLQEINKEGFDLPEQPFAAQAPFPDQVLGHGETRIATCINWRGQTGWIQWEENGRETICMVKRFMIFEPRRSKKRQLFINEPVRITIKTHLQMHKERYVGAFEGDPDQLRTELTLVQPEKYITTNKRMQELYEMGTLHPAQEEKLLNLMNLAAEQYTAILPERQKLLKFQRWHDKVQSIARRKLGLTKSIRETLQLIPPDVTADGIWNRVRFYRGWKKENLIYGRRQELAHLRHLADVKLDTDDLAAEEQTTLIDCIELINGWLAPFEQK